MEQFSPISINDISLSSFKAALFFDDTFLSTATCFIYEVDNQNYLVTNLHVVKGRNPATKKVIASSGAIPNIMKIAFYIEKNGVTAGTTQIVVNLYDNRRNPLEDKPNWYQAMPDTLIDIAVIKIELPKEVCFNPINKVYLDYNEHTNIQIADPVFVVGYPRGIDVDGLPIWKKASIASEPDIDVGDLPKILIDTATREGMSGSPVIYYEKRAVILIDNADNTLKHSDRFFKFLGVYSGRILGEDELASQLGVVWKSTIIDKIIENTKTRR